MPDVTNASVKQETREKILKERRYKVRETKMEQGRRGRAADNSGCS